MNKPWKLFSFKNQRHLRVPFFLTCLSALSPLGHCAVRHARPRCQIEMQRRLGHEVGRHRRRDEHKQRDQQLGNAGAALGERHLHAPTKASTLGVGGVLIASMLVAFSQGRPGIAELLITLFVFVTAPVSANLMAQAALHLNLASRARVPDGAVPERRKG